MGQGSKWAKGQDGILLFTPPPPKKKEKSRTISEQQERKSGRVKMGHCCLPPERVKLTVNSKKKQIAGSKWAKGQDRLLLSTPLTG